MFKRRIYLDYASLTPIDRRVSREMQKYLGMEYTNPSSLYREGVAARKALQDARVRVAGFLRAQPSEIYFTSGGTEANNIAIFGVVESARKQGIEYRDMHVLASVIEHSSVRECIIELQKRGVQSDFVEVDGRGVVSLEDLKKKLKPNTVLVSIMTVNNEIGTVQPIREIAKVIRHARKNLNCQALFHTDAAQAALYQELNTENLGVDLLTLDGSKVYGPRGIGALYMSRTTLVSPIIFGGGQERGLRSGTENISAIMGFAKALDVAKNERVAEKTRISALRKAFVEGIKKFKPGITINGDDVEVSPHIINVSIPGIDNEFFVLQLDAKGIACSTKSSCLRDAEESYVLKAIGADSQTSVRFSLGRGTRKGDIDRAFKAVKTLIDKA